jgi:hypothetical protein
VAYSDYSVAFDGVDDYVDLGNVISLERTDPFTWCFWAKCTSLSASRGHIYKLEASPGYRGYGFSQQADSKFWFHLINDWATNNAIAVSSLSAFPITNRWFHIAWTYDGSSAAAGVALYIDGFDQLLTVSKDGLTATIQTTQNLAFGIRPAALTTFQFAGNLDDIQFYNRVLTKTEIQALAGFPNTVPVDPSLLGTWSNNGGLWRMGDGDTYPTLQDSGNGTSNDGIMTNMDAGDIEAEGAGPLLVNANEAERTPLGYCDTGEGCIVLQYLMRGINISNNYVHWKVAGEPDLTATYAPETIPDLSTVTIAAKWT